MDVERKYWPHDINSFIRGINGVLCPGSHDKQQFERWLSRQEQEHFMLFGKWQRMFICIKYNMVRYIDKSRSIRCHWK